MKNAEQRIKALEERNRRVERDKAWETSLTRRLAITLLTYSTVCFYLLLIDSERPFITAVVPALGYYLSTLVIKSIRSLWSNNHR